MYKRLVEMTDVMNEKNEKDYLKQAMVEVKEKDKKIDTSILEKKSGYDLFNTIFFERFRDIPRLKRPCGGRRRLYKKGKI